MAVKTTCPYCGVGCGVVAEQGRGGRGHRPRRSACIPPISASSARRDRRWPKPSVSKDACSSRWSTDRRQAGMPRWRMSPTDSARRSASTGRIRWPSTFRASCSPRIITSSTSSRRALSAPPISTPIRGCAWPPAWSATSAPSAATRFPVAMKIWNRPICWCWSAPTPPGAIRSCISACWRQERKIPTCRIVVIDPRRTATCEGADLHLPLRSGSDAVLFNGLLAHLREDQRGRRRLRRRIHHRRGGSACAGRRPDHHAHRRPSAG